jgi:hypothetical protein
MKFTRGNISWNADWCAEDLTKQIVPILVWDFFATLVYLCAFARTIPGAKKILRKGAKQLGRPKESRATFLASLRGT